MLENIFKMRFITATQPLDYINIGAGNFHAAIRNLMLMSNAYTLFNPYLQGTIAGFNFHSCFSFNF